MADQLDGAGKAQRPAASHLFLVRLWEESGDGSQEDRTPDGNGTHPNVAATSDREWKGKVQHVVSGESHTFHDLTSLVEYLRSMIPGQAQAKPSSSPATAE